MQAERFDTLSRIFGSRTSRRMAVGLAATGLLSVAVPDVAAASCSARKPCPDCKKCRKHRCKPDAAQDGHGCSGGRCDGGKCIATPTCAPVCDTCQRCDNGACVEDSAKNGTVCTGGGICESGTCQPATCPALEANCTDVGQCAPDCEGAVACGPIGNLGQNQCCRPLGAPCSTPGAWEECCTVVEGGNLVYCGSNHTCGGPGATCHTSSICASGVCCGSFLDPFGGACCAAGQRCEGFSCVN